MHVACKHPASSLPDLKQILVPKGIANYMASCEKGVISPLVKKGLLKELFPEDFVVWGEKRNYLAVSSPKAQVAFHDIPEACVVVT